MTIAYSYIRFSSKGQVLGDSLNRQLSAARAYAKRHNLVLNESSYQDLGISAFKSKNATEGALKAFLDAVDEGAIPSNVTLLIENFDRLSRAQVQDALELFLSITKRGVTIVTLSDEQIYNRKTINENWTKLIITLATFARAHEESAIKSMRTRTGKQNALAQGFKLGKHPFWLKLEDDKRTFTVLEDKAKIVRECFDMRLKGIGAHRIAQHVNKTYGFKYGTPQVARLLQNPAVIGTRVSQAGYEPRLKYYEPIIEKGLFYEVQRLMSANIGTKRGRRPEDEPNLFTGLLRCSKCGGTMRFFRPTKTVSQSYIRCLSAVTGAGCDVQGFVNYDVFEKEVIGWLLLDQDEEFVSVLDRKPVLQAITGAKLQELRDQQSRLIDLVASGLMNPTLVGVKLNAIEQQIKDQEAVIEAPVPESMFAEKAWALVERHENALLAVADGEDPQELYAVRRELKAAFARSIERLTVHPERRVNSVHHCKFSVVFRGYEGEPEREYTRPALNHVKGVWNGSQDTHSTL
jgi:DNA invertase Pin-like site-specific DNA recombinase